MSIQLSAYLLFNGQCEEAFRFYEKCLGGKIVAMLPYEGSPAAEQVPAEFRSKILHALLTVDGQSLMASDAPPGRYSEPKGFSVSLQMKDVKEAERIFQALAENGKVGMPFQETFWAARFGMVVDRFGTPWMVNCEKAA
jgi:PhnB protein